MSRRRDMGDEKPAPLKRRTPATDWSEVRQRLDAVRETVERDWMPTPDKKKRILKDRARALAQAPKGEEASGEHIDVLEFMLAYEKYAVESRYVREVYPLKDLTPLPCVSPFVLGIINVRGQIVSVIDVKKFFDLPEKGLTDLNKVIIIHNDAMEFGVLADVILGMRRIALGDIQPSLPTLTGIREQYLKGVTPEGVVLLDAEKLLGDKNIVVYEEVES
jgi:purine-binding chemotaxis protein CheW